MKLFILIKKKWECFCVCPLRLRYVRSAKEKHKTDKRPENWHKKNVTRQWKANGEKKLKNDNNRHFYCAGKNGHKIHKIRISTHPLWYALTPSIEILKCIRVHNSTLISIDGIPSVWEKNAAKISSFIHCAAFFLYSPYLFTKMKFSVYYSAFHCSDLT